MYGTAREAKLIDSILESLKKTDIQLYKNSVSEFDRIQRLEKWCLDLLLIIESYLQQQIYAEPALLEDGNADNEDNNNNNNNDDVYKENNETGADPFNPEEPDPNAPEI